MSDVSLPRADDYARFHREPHPLPDRPARVARDRLRHHAPRQYSCGSFWDWAFGALRDQHVPLNLFFGVFAGMALLSVFMVLLIKPHQKQSQGHRRSCSDRFHQA